ncbi:MAG TPA: metallophosphoesterase [Gemmatimonadaceae bacterium]|nr:metallophosphoesterase [Gemmatimonadaceae bacterium]
MFVVEHTVAHVLTEPALAGYRIAAIGDFHIAPWRSTRAIERAVVAINAWEPDVVVLVGDYGHSIRGFRGLARKWYAMVIPRVVRALATLRARDGVFAVLGNHDADGGADAVTHALHAAGITVLRNSGVDIRRNAATVRISGVEATPGPTDMTAVLGSGANVIVLASHHPDVITDWPIQPSAPLIVLAGHTHGGQIAFPRIGAPITLSHVATRRFPSGFVPNEKATLYVTRGLGEQFPIRVMAPREVTLLELAAR